MKLTFQVEGNFSHFFYNNVCMPKTLNLKIILPFVREVLTLFRLDELCYVMEEALQGCTEYHWWWDSLNWIVPGSWQWITKCFLFLYIDRRMHAWSPRQTHSGRNTSTTLIWNITRNYTSLNWRLLTILAGSSLMTGPVHHIWPFLLDIITPRDKGQG